MAFRADEAAQNGFEKCVNYLLPRSRNADDADRSRSMDVLIDLRDKYGPVIESYPTWHPLVSNHDDRSPTTTPGERCGYRGVDHSVYFAHAFITCPYGDGQAVMDSVAALPAHPIAEITAERLDVRLYDPNATPILVKCAWDRHIEPDGSVPLGTAMALLLAKELPCWTWSELAETWESMRSYFLGRPHGSRSSLFVSQESGQALKKVWETVIYTGVFGPIKV